jgi:hypothetical protein
LNNALGNPLGTSFAFVQVANGHRDVLNLLPYVSGLSAASQSFRVFRRGGSSKSQREDTGTQLEGRIRGRSSISRSGPVPPGRGSAVRPPRSLPPNNQPFLLCGPPHRAWMPRPAGDILPPRVTGLDGPRAARNARSPPTDPHGRTLSPRRAAGLPPVWNAGGRGATGRIAGAACVAPGRRPPPEAGGPGYGYQRSDRVQRHRRLGPRPLPSAGSRAVSHSPATGAVP